MQEWIKRQHETAVAAVTLTVIVLAFVMVIGLASATGHIGDHTPQDCQALARLAGHAVCQAKP